MRVGGGGGGGGGEGEELLGPIGPVLSQVEEGDGDHNKAPNFDNQWDSQPIAIAESRHAWIER